MVWVFLKKKDETHEKNLLVWIYFYAFLFVPHSLFGEFAVNESELVSIHTLAPSSPRPPVAIQDISRPVHVCGLSHKVNGVEKR